MAAMLGAGKSQRQIAIAVGVSRKTVRLYAARK
jgi:DNA-binding CsgD family transcriptional regulator